MNCKSLMIGDWVFYCNKSFQVDYFVRIPNVIGLKYNGTKPFPKDGAICAEDASPIPLTAEILEKNGFEAETFLSSEWDCEVYFREFPGCVVEPDDAGYTFGTISYWGKQANDGSPEDWGTMYESRIKGLHYVHELQRALRCCGLWDLAENFKI